MSKCLVCHYEVNLYKDSNSYYIYMAFNSSALVGTVNGMFDVIKALISNTVDLITGDLLVLTIVGLLIAFIVAVVVAVVKFVKNTTQNAMPKMGGK